MLDYIQKRGAKTRPKLYRVKSDEKGNRLKG